MSLEGGATVRVDANGTGHWNCGLVDIRTDGGANGGQFKVHGTMKVADGASSAIHFPAAIMASDVSLGFGMKVGEIVTAKQLSLHDGGAAAEAAVAGMAGWDSTNGPASLNVLSGGSLEVVDSTTLFASSAAVEPASVGAIASAASEVPAALSSASSPELRVPLLIHTGGNLVVSSQTQLGLRGGGGANAGASVHFGQSARLLLDGSPFAVNATEAVNYHSISTQAAFVFDSRAGFTVAEPSQAPDQSAPESGSAEMLIRSGHHVLRANTPEGLTVRVIGGSLSLSADLPLSSTAGPSLNGVVIVEGSGSGAGGVLRCMSSSAGVCASAAELRVRATGTIAMLTLQPQQADGALPQPRTVRSMGPATAVSMARCPAGYIGIACHCTGPTCAGSFWGDGGNGTSTATNANVCTAVASSKAPAGPVRALLTCSGSGHGMVSTVVADSTISATVAAADAAYFADTGGSLGLPRTAVNAGADAAATRALRFGGVVARAQCGPGGVVVGCSCTTLDLGTNGISCTSRGAGWASSQRNENAACTVYGRASATTTASARVRAVARCADGPAVTAPAVLRVYRRLHWTGGKIMGEGRLRVGHHGSSYAVIGEANRAADAGKLVLQDSAVVEFAGGCIAKWNCSIGAGLLSGEMQLGGGSHLRIGSNASLELHAPLSEAAASPAGCNISVGDGEESTLQVTAGGKIHVQSGVVSSSARALIAGGIWAGAQTESAATVAAAAAPSAEIPFAEMRLAAGGQAEAGATVRVGAGGALLFGNGGTAPFVHEWIHPATYDVAPSPTPSCVGGFDEYTTIERTPATALEPTARWQIFHGPSRFYSILSDSNSPPVGAASEWHYNYLTSVSRSTRTATVVEGHCDGRPSYDAAVCTPVPIIPSSSIVPVNDCPRHICVTIGDGRIDGDYEEDTSTSGFLRDSVPRYKKSCGTDAPPGPVCGNGFREGTEACDDGDTFDNDGCSSSCQVEQAWTSSGVSVPGLAEPVLKFGVSAGVHSVPSEVQGVGLQVEQNTAVQIPSAANMSGLHITTVQAGGWLRMALGSTLESTNFRVHCGGVVMGDDDASGYEAYHHNFTQRIVVNGGFDLNPASDGYCDTGDSAFPDAALVTAPRLFVQAQSLRVGPGGLIHSDHVHNRTVGDGGRGGSHGGVGGAGRAFVAATGAFGSAVQPDSLGNSGGDGTMGSADTMAFAGGAGGGHITVHVELSLHVDGSVRASGAAGTSGGGGGAGGSIVMLCESSTCIFAGNGTVSANGGDGGVCCMRARGGGGGSGGRISLSYPERSFTGNLQAFGGAEGSVAVASAAAKAAPMQRCGAAGTIFVQRLGERSGVMQPVWQTLIVGNGNGDGVGAANCVNGDPAGFMNGTAANPTGAATLDGALDTESQAWSLNPLSASSVDAAKPLQLDDVLLSGHARLEIDGGARGVSIGRLEAAERVAVTGGWADAESALASARADFAASVAVPGASLPSRKWATPSPTPGKTTAISGVVALIAGNLSIAQYSAGSSAIIATSDRSCAQGCLPTSMAQCQQMALEMRLPFEAATQENLMTAPPGCYWFVDPAASGSRNGVLRFNTATGSTVKCDGSNTAGQTLSNACLCSCPHSASYDTHIQGVGLELVGGALLGATQAYFSTLRPLAVRVSSGGLLAMHPTATTVPAADSSVTALRDLRGSSPGGTFVFSTLEVTNAGAVQTHECYGQACNRSVFVSASTVKVHSGGQIHADGLGSAFAAATGSPGGAGGGHGGIGAPAPTVLEGHRSRGLASEPAAEVATGGVAHGSVSLPVTPGGAGGRTRTGAGGRGGGVLHLHAGALTLDGVISAHGGDGTADSGAGGGAGGSVLIEVVGQWDGAGSVSANGGFARSAANFADRGGEASCGGGGGGGRVAVFYGPATMGTAFTGDTSAFGGAARCVRCDGIPVDAGVSEGMPIDVVAEASESVHVQSTSLKLPLDGSAVTNEFLSEEGGAYTFFELPWADNVNGVRLSAFSAEAGAGGHFMYAACGLAAARFPTRRHHVIRAEAQSTRVQVLTVLRPHHNASGVLRFSVLSLAGKSGGFNLTAQYGNFSATTGAPISRRGGAGTVYLQQRNPQSAGIVRAVNPLYHALSVVNDADPLGAATPVMESVGAYENGILDRLRVAGGARLALRAGGAVCTAEVSAEPGMFAAGGVVRVEHGGALLMSCPSGAVNCAHNLSGSVTVDMAAGALALQASVADTADLTHADTVDGSIFNVQGGASVLLGAEAHSAEFNSSSNTIGSRSANGSFVFGTLTVGSGGELASGAGGRSIGADVDVGSQSSYHPRRFWAASNARSFPESVLGASMALAGIQPPKVSLQASTLTVEKNGIIHSNGLGYRGATPAHDNAAGPGNGASGGGGLAHGVGGGGGGHGGAGTAAQVRNGNGASLDSDSAATVSAAARASLPAASVATRTPCAASCVGSSLEQCRSLAAALQLPYSESSSENTTTSPPGCYWFVDRGVTSAPAAGGVLRFNSAASSLVQCDGKLVPGSSHANQCLCSCPQTGGHGGGAYGSTLAPLAAGSGGGAALSGGGGAGGGVVDISVLTLLVLDGIVSANGRSGALRGGGGGGAGGSVSIACKGFMCTLAGNGTVHANGGNGGFSSAAAGGGGGGGRISVSSATDLFTGSLHAVGGWNMQFGSSGLSVAGAGTAYRHIRGDGRVVGDASEYGAALIGQQRSLSVDAGYHDDADHLDASTVVGLTAVTSDAGEAVATENAPLRMSLESLHMRGGAQLQVSGAGAVLSLASDLTADGRYETYAAAPSLVIMNGTQLVLPEAFQMNRVRLNMRGGMLNHSGLNGTLTVGGASQLQLHYEGNTVVNGDTSAAGTYTWSSLNVHTGGEIEVHSRVSGDSSGDVVIGAASVRVYGGGRIHADGLGHAGAVAGVKGGAPLVTWEEPPAGPGTATYGEHGAAGGAHAGLGGDPRLAARLTVADVNSSWISARHVRPAYSYGSVFAPNQPGSGGGASFYGDGGAGGGRLKMMVTSMLTLDGSISADGAAATEVGAGGGGAGGSIWLVVGGLTGSSTTASIRASGGNGGAGNLPVSGRNNTDLSPGGNVEHEHDHGHEDDHDHDHDQESGSVGCGGGGAGGRVFISYAEEGLMHITGGIDHYEGTAAATGGGIHTQCGATFSSSATASLGAPQSIGAAGTAMWQLRANHLEPLTHRLEVAAAPVLAVNGTDRQWWNSTPHTTVLVATASTAMSIDELNIRKGAQLQFSGGGIVSISSNLTGDPGQRFRMHGDGHQTSGPGWDHDEHEHDHEAGDADHHRRLGATAGDLLPTASVVVTKGTQLRVPETFLLSRMRLEVRGVLNHSIRKCHRNQPACNHSGASSMLIDYGGQLQLHSEGSAVAVATTSEAGVYEWSTLDVLGGGVLAVASSSSDNASTVRVNGDGGVLIRAARAHVHSGGVVHADGLGYAGGNRYFDNALGISKGQFGVQVSQFVYCTA
jgi:cysteine-rich repeat protein